ncbi:hypothetical protein [Antarcticirhabdus aurantiaca]|uniref:Uncharacterized protein n=1 Tax=Antarcticirhabdus aurantiaca TaxID=2606717 RepID=A0ACD4NPI3_9HYPH|nr:hypothetical protein [Antarcticirhabdus aurantiaca]WAJ28710.1 hypothetical protein OXU80_00190 [Jeongeuplla avenae]
MTAAILSFGRRKPNAAPLPSKMPWQNQDLAELYRVRDRLCAAGLSVEVEGGVSDEGDPWFVYCQSGTDNVVVHIARLGTEIHVINCVTGGTYVGSSFRDVSDRMLDDAPVALGAQLRRSSNVVLHPSAFLTAFVAAALMLVDLLEHGRAEAAETHGGHHGSDGAFGVVIEGTSGRIPAQGLSDPAEKTPQHAGLAASEASTDEGDGPLTRRLQKDGPSGSVAPTQSAAPASHAGFLADAPASVLSTTLSVGLFAAELLRIFAQEQASVREDDFDAAVSNEIVSALPMSDHRDAPSGLHDASSALAGGSLESVQSANAASAKVDVPLHPLTLAPQATVPAAHAPEGELAPAPIGKPGASPAAAPHLDKAAEASAGTNLGGMTAAPAAHAPSDQPTAPPAGPPESAAPTSAVPAPAIRAEAAAVVVATTLDLDLVVSRLAKSTEAFHTASLAQASPKAPADTGKAVDGPPAAGGVDLTSGGKTAIPALDDHGKGSALPPLLPDHADAGGGSFVPDFVRGKVDILLYEAGQNMSVEGFVLFEDILTFADQVTAATFFNSFARDGNDIVFGDADHGQLRLVGVLLDPVALAAEGPSPHAG